MVFYNYGGFIRERMVFHNSWSCRCQVCFGGFIRERMVFYNFLACFQVDFSWWFHQGTDGILQPGGFTIITGDWWFHQGTDGILQLISCNLFRTFMLKINCGVKITIMGSPTSYASPFFFVFQITVFRTTNTAQFA